MIIFTGSDLHYLYMLLCFLGSTLFLMTYTGLSILSFSRSFLISALLIVGLILIDKSGVLFLDIFPLLLILLGTRIKTGVISFLFLIWGVFLAGPVSLFYVLLIAPLLYSNINKYRYTITAITICVSFVVSYYSALNSSLFDYPADASLVPISHFTNLGDVIWGPQKTPFHLNPENFYTIKNLKYLNISLSLILLCLFVGYYYYSYRDSENKIPYHLYISFFLFLIVFLGSLYGEKYFIYSPEASFYKIIPGMIFRYYPMFLPGVGFLFGVIGLGIISSRHGKNLLFPGIVLIFSLMNFNYNFLKKDYSVSAMSSDELAKLSVESLYEVSPSSFLNTAYGKKFKNDKISKLKDKEFKSVNLDKNNFCNTSASKNSSNSKIAIDGNYKQRWSTQSPQSVGDWFELTCNKPLKLSRITLSIEDFKSDFPRGLIIEVINTENNKKKIFDLYKNWYGPIKFTKSGLPYFASQGDVILDLPYEVEANKFKFILSESDSKFDWSIVEILFYR